MSNIGSSALGCPAAVPVKLLAQSLLLSPTLLAPRSKGHYAVLQRLALKQKPASTGSLQFAPLLDFNISTSPCPDRSVKDTKHYLLMLRRHAHHLTEC